LFIIAVAVHPAGQATESIPDTVNSTIMSVDVMIYYYVEVQEKQTPSRFLGACG